MNRGKEALPKVGRKKKGQKSLKTWLIEKDPKKPEYISGLASRLQLGQSQHDLQQVHNSDPNENIMLAFQMIRISARNPGPN